MLASAGDNIMGFRNDALEGQGLPYSSERLNRYRVALESPIRQNLANWRTSMETILTRSPGKAAEIIKRGGIVAFPTETVYGLGADVFNSDAVARIFDAKMRPADNPLIAHIGDLSQISYLAADVPESASQLIAEFFPGPLTVVLKRSAAVPLIATAGLDSIGVRMPGNELASDFLKKCGSPVVAPSANLSGRPSPTTWKAVLEDLNGRIDCILQGHATKVGLESTVVDCTVEPPVVLRSGAVSLEELKSVVPAIEPYQPLEGEAPRSPGLKHRHYSPKANVFLFDAGPPTADHQADACICISNIPNEFAYFMRCDSTEEYASQLYEFFRECDRKGIDNVFCETVPETGLGAALMDRLRRAAEK